MRLDKLHVGRRDRLGVACQWVFALAMYDMSGGFPQAS